MRKRFEPQTEPGQFLLPNDGWKNDLDFQNDCLVFTLFHGQNRISSNGGANDWIPFTEYEATARDKFDSNFMTDFIAGKTQPGIVSEPMLFFTGRDDFGAGLYDIREHFQGRNPQGKMNNASPDETYNELINALRRALKVLAKKIEPKIYEYGFLKQ